MKTHPEQVACGDTVYDERDPRHIGRVIGFIRGGQVNVRFEETKWRGDIPWRHFRFYDEEK